MNKETSIELTNEVVTIKTITTYEGIQVGTPHLDIYSKTDEDMKRLQKDFPDWADAILTKWGNPPY